MSITEYMAVCATVCIVWYLMVYTSKHEDKHAHRVGSVCDGVGEDWCGKRCDPDERLCEGCKRIVRAQEIKGEQQ